jgi:hypothetical protein
MQQSSSISESIVYPETILCQMTKGSLTLSFAHQFGIYGIKKQFPISLRLIKEILLKYGTTTEDIVVLVKGLSIFHFGELSSKVTRNKFLHLLIFIVLSGKVR